MKPLPQLDRTPSPAAGRVLVWVALVLIPLDLSLCLYGDSLTVIEIIEPLEQAGTYAYWVWSPFWVGGLRIGIPCGILALLIWSGYINRRDVGLTLGQPRVSLFWVIAPAMVATGLVFAILALIFTYGTFTEAPWLNVFVEPRSLLREYPSAYYFWLFVWELIIFAPLMEDTLYRAILVPALENLGGWRLALLGSGVMWTGLHLLYQRPVWWMGFYFFCGAFGAWVFLKSRSLLPVILLHMLTNLAGDLFLDLSRLF